MIGIERAESISKYAKKHGVFRAADKFNVSVETVKRYKRKFLSGVKQVLSINVDDRPAHLPKVLIFDIETSPILARVWSIWQQNVGLNQIKEDWFIMSYAAKWLGVDGVIYQDLRGVIDNGSDEPLLQGIWQLLNDADIVVTQNGKKFDCKKLNARFVLNGYQPPSGYKHIDTLVIAKRIFGFTSNKLEYMTEKLCTKYKKQTNREFNGFDLWRQCLADNTKAWDCMENYNKYDVLSLEELYTILAAWDNRHPNFNLFTDDEQHVCRCGCEDVIPYGFSYTQVSKFQKYRCTKCGAETRGRRNLFDDDKRAGLHVNIYN